MPLDMQNFHRQIVHKIASHEALVGVIGLGYVGLPLGLRFGEGSVELMAESCTMFISDQLNMGGL